MEVFSIDFSLNVYFLTMKTRKCWQIQVCIILMQTIYVLYPHLTIQCIKVKHKMVEWFSLYNNINMKSLIQIFQYFVITSGGLNHLTVKYIIFFIDLRNFHSKKFHFVRLIKLKMFFPLTAAKDCGCYVL